MGKRKEFIGVVISDKMQKTRIVKIMSLSKHPKYNRINKTYSKYKAHDEKNISAAGDTVEIIETRPISKDKRFRVSRIIKKAEAAHLKIKEQELENDSTT